MHVNASYYLFVCSLFGQAPVLTWLVSQVAQMQAVCEARKREVHEATAKAEVKIVT
jgi:hypothetical protein